MTPVKFNEKEIREINEIIAEISKVIKPKSEIGARSKATLSGLLASSNAKKPSTSNVSVNIPMLLSTTL